MIEKLIQKIKLWKVNKKFSKKKRLIQKTNKRFNKKKKLIQKIKLLKIKRTNQKKKLILFKNRCT